MIYDTLNNLPNYLGVSDNLDTVIEYIMARDITTLPAGRTRIDGEKAVVTVSTVTPLTSDKALFQRHDNHITLETDLDGSELFEVSLAELTPTKPTDEAADTTVGTAGTSIAGMLCEGRFALYLAGEPYKSGLKAQGCGKLKKSRVQHRAGPGRGRNGRITERRFSVWDFLLSLLQACLPYSSLPCSAAIRCCSGASSPCGWSFRLRWCWLFWCGRS